MHQWPGVDEAKCRPAQANRIWIGSPPWPSVKRAAAYSRSWCRVRAFIAASLAVRSVVASKRANPSQSPPLNRRQRLYYRGIRR